MREISWTDHLRTASGLTVLLNVAADRVADPEAQAGLRVVAQAISGHIEQGVSKL